MHINVHSMFINVNTNTNNNSQSNNNHHHINKYNNDNNNQKLIIIIKVIYDNDNHHHSLNTIIREGRRAMDALERDHDMYVCILCIHMKLFVYIVC